jgi:hypothetical protein
MMMFALSPCSPLALLAQLTTSGEELEKPEVEKQSKKPSDMIKMRLMWRKSVSEKVSPSTY